MHMATNVQIDPDLIRDALLLGGKRTKYSPTAFRSVFIARPRQGEKGR